MKANVRPAGFVYPLSSVQTAGRVSSRLFSETDGGHTILSFAVTFMNLLFQYQPINDAPLLRVQFVVSYDCQAVWRTSDVKGWKVHCARGASWPS